MAKRLSRAERSRLMAAVHGAGNLSTELRLIAMFRKYGITGWRRAARLPGRPDFIFPLQRVAVFVDGCFWHGCPQHYRRPNTRRAYWDAKVARNRARDRKVGQLLREKGWRVLRLWEHALIKRGVERSIAKIRRGVTFRP